MSVHAMYMLRIYIFICTYVFIV